MQFYSDSSPVSQGGLACEEYILGLSASLSTKPQRIPKKQVHDLAHNLVIPKRSDAELIGIMIRLRRHPLHTGHEIELTKYWEIDILPDDAEECQMLNIQGCFASSGKPGLLQPHSADSDSNTKCMDTCVQQGKQVAGTKVGLDRVGLG